MPVAEIFERRRRAALPRAGTRRGRRRVRVTGAARDRVRRRSGARRREPEAAARPRASSCGCRRRRRCSARVSATAPRDRCSPATRRVATLERLARAARARVRGRRRRRRATPRIATVDAVAAAVSSRSCSRGTGDASRSRERALRRRHRRRRVRASSRPCSTAAAGSSIVTPARHRSRRAAASRRAVGTRRSHGRRRGREVARHRRDAVPRVRAAGPSRAAMPSSRSAAAWSATPRDSRLPSTTAASTVVQVPTTLLAMVDAAIGGKTGVNLPEGKNLVGAFHQPIAVVADVPHSRRCPTASSARGLGEVAKYALHAAGRRTSRRDPRAGRRHRRPRPRRAHRAGRRVRGDQGRRRRRRPEERTGLRATLNYGHTLAHALETAGAYELAARRGGRDRARVRRRARGGARAGRRHRVDQHRQLLESLDLPTTVPEACERRRSCSR